VRFLAFFDGFSGSFRIRLEFVFIRACAPLLFVVLKVLQFLSPIGLIEAKLTLAPLQVPLIIPRVFWRLRILLLRTCSSSLGGQCRISSPSSARAMSECPSSFFEEIWA